MLRVHQSFAHSCPSVLRLLCLDDGRRAESVVSSKKEVSSVRFHFLLIKRR